MYRKIVICLTLICFIISVQGCTSRYTIPCERLKEKPEHKCLIIETVDGDVYEFEHVSVHDDYIEGYALVYDDMRVYVVDSVLVSVLLEDVESVRVLRYDVTKTTWYALGALGVFALGCFIAALIVLSHIDYY
ncbi:hypothetical protein AMJ87_08280 [candidate division WOR_3 bacterium SM23_60]|uniref:Uncharacterized protein n=1 Tax=candidate division WOR_3 bacterium SM23_60 TaxID=1703780 RepID=A0A0S8GE73_UNCW3|nr:MAG: hypothetical protein AMJ87_08280 [candidate division WOR_3 bacterium SM23_60]